MDLLTQWLQLLTMLAPVSGARELSVGAIELAGAEARVAAPPKASATVMM